MADAACYRPLVCFLALLVVVAAEGDTGVSLERQSASAAKYQMAPTDTTVMIDGREIPHFKVGLLAPWEMSYGDFSALTSASAISLAIEAIHADPSLNGSMRFSVISYDSACSSKMGAGNAVRLMVEEKVDAFIGPACSASCRPAAELASYWNKPIVSWVATDPDFNDKDTYTTLGRVLGPFDKMGLFLLDVFAQYGWRRCAILSSNYFLWLDASRAITKVFRENNMTIAYEAQYDRYPPDYLFTNILTKTKEEARIVLVIAPKEDRRRLMLKAHDLGMTKGEYVFYTIEMLPDENVLKAEDVWSSDDGRDLQAKQAFEAVFHVTLAALANAAVNDFRKEVARRMLIPPWISYVGNDIKMKNFNYGDKYSPFLYDAMMLYAVSLNESIAKGSDPRSGVAIAEMMKGKAFQGMTGNLVLDQNGDREPDYWITDMHPNGTFLKIAEIVNKDNGARVFRPNILDPRWPNGKVGHQFAPPDTPKCGYRNELCPDNSIPSWVFILITLLVVIAIAVGAGVGVFLYKRAQFETNLLVQGWKIRYEDIEPIKAGKTKGGSTPTLSSLKSFMDSSGHIAGNSKGEPSIGKSKSSMPTTSICTGGGQMFTDVGMYGGVIIAIKHIKKTHMQVSRNVLLEFNELKEIIHENLNVFVGACIEPPNICLIWQYCGKGSLQDVLFDDGMKLDNTFKLSFMSDIAKGMVYIHSSHLISHGNLKSSNCLIDKRWTLKITDYGLPSFLSGQESNKENEADLRKQKMWTAPEILRENFPSSRGTQKGDVYSFSIICYEIMMRSEPYCFDTITPRDVVNRIRNGESIPYRPKLPESTDLGRPLIDLLKICWDENAEQRPAFLNVRSMLRKITGGEINILDNILRMMEKFANNLEEIVEERTQQLVEEKKKTDRLLYRMLPSTVAEALKAGTFVKPENYDQATLYFSDIVGFTQLAAESNPMQIVEFLNDLYSCFDDIIEKHDVYKVETIGDAYMCVSGVPVRNGTRHTQEIANCALDLLSEVTHLKIKHRPNQQLQLKIGLHMGPVVAGVVGNIMPRYCLFGDTVNMSARMESNGKPLRIHISKILFNALSEIGIYDMTLRGEMSVKGKGLQTTYWLHGKKGFDKPLPSFDREAVAKEQSGPGQQSIDGGARSAMMQSYDSATVDEKQSLPTVV